MVITGAFAIALLLAQAEDYLPRGLEALNANQPAAAESLFRKAVAADPSDFQAQFNLALVLGLEQKDTEAISVYRRTLELKPALYEADLNLGIILLRGKMPADAAPVLKQASEMKPGELRPQLYYAQALFQIGEFQQAEKHYRDAVSIDPKSAAANLGIGRALLKQSKLNEAAPFYRTAASLDTTYKNTLLELGAECDKAGRTDEAIAIFREFPSNPEVASRLAQLLLESNDAAAAIPQLEAQVKRAPTTANRLMLIEAYKRTSQTVKVLEQLQLATAADPSNFDLQMSWGRVLRDQRRFVEAARQFRAAAALKPDSLAALNELAGVLIVSENYDEGLAVLDRVRATGKEIPGDVYLRAITLDKLHRQQPAVDAYKQFLAVADGKYPDEEFLSRQRVRIIEGELKK
jgi:Tfp pilus assembly protein PilF